MTLLKNFGLAICGALAFAGTTATAAQGYRMLLSGPAESVDRSTNTVTVLGHRLVLTSAANILPGHKLNVFGVVKANGLLAASLVQDTGRFAASGDSNH